VGTARAITALAAAAALATTASSCSLVDAGLEQAADAAAISLQAPGSLDEVPQLPNLQGADPNVQDQPPGLSTVLATYGRNDIPVLTLHAYAGAPAGVSVVRTTYDKTVGGENTGSSRCSRQSQQAATCWRSQDNLLVAVSTIDGRELTDLAKVVDEAWTSVRS
jgi:hypothetical protein